jgi:D-arabinose 1-dehydrogenase-like Zn-dependent alcohol dehydrogenase
VGRGECPARVVSVTAADGFKASTLACAGVTAWNALDGLKDVPEGAYALLQGKIPLPAE